jgi:hypothetical protein
MKLTRYNGWKNQPELWTLISVAGCLEDKWVLITLINYSFIFNYGEQK